MTLLWALPFAYLGGFLSAIAFGAWRGMNTVDQALTGDDNSPRECSHPEKMVVDFSSFGNPLFRCLSCGQEAASPLSISEVN